MTNILRSHIRAFLAGNREALLLSFNWTKTPEGHEYWQKVFDEAYPITGEAHDKLLAMLNSRPLRGFALLSPERHREIAAKGGRSVPAEKRPFSQSPDLAKTAGAKGGKATRKRATVQEGPK